MDMGFADLDLDMDLDMHMDVDALLGIAPAMPKDGSSKVAAADDYGLTQALQASVAADTAPAALPMPEEVNLQALCKDLGLGNEQLPQLTLEGADAEADLKGFEELQNLNFEDLDFALPRSLSVNVLSAPASELVHNEGHLDAVAPAVDNAHCHEAFRPVTATAAAAAAAAKSLQTKKAPSTKVKRQAASTSASAGTQDKDANRGSPAKKAKLSKAAKEPKEVNQRGQPRKRRPKVAVAEHLKDEAYLAYRELNNERARRCREKKREEKRQASRRLQTLDAENERLKDEMHRLQDALKDLVQAMQARVAQAYAEEEVPEDMQASVQRVANTTSALCASY
ncbi:uncharacterized protein MONBRDRAFT_31571 [Monosiga brevicollis MX1]|uniref:BZIP domain-containing protein n=1 Tax=Monosiga brevicollis TaxID=81824 RepID=A9UU10_MONBE|nr:uncharacterized protein MONBRDRAFT_31571 [Monosiga brevicollis MX1]EDQ91340.1 predicted protein [Monosiga brevicollis MX1]|eukprot:XP_001743762.1 hypothetical protein [Monosiga brevicollis MX1]